MKTYAPQTMVCTQQERAGDQKKPVCAIVLEAPTLLALSKRAADWMNTHPDYRLLTFSHALETRLEPVASLAGPRPYKVYTGVLLVGSPSRPFEPEQPERSSQDKMLLSHR